MAEIQVETERIQDGWSFIVTVSNGPTTKHEVTLSTEHYRALTGGKVAPEELVRKSFNFLLEREANTAILPKFDLLVIKNYFPEYEDEIKSHINSSAT